MEEYFKIASKFATDNTGLAYNLYNSGNYTPQQHSEKTDADELVANHRQFRETYAEYRRSGYITSASQRCSVPSSFDPQKKHLYRPITYEELEATNRYQDRKISGYIYEKAFITGAVQILLRVDREARKLLRVSIYGHDSTHETVENDFPEGTNITIYCPFYKKSQDGKCGLRVDNLKDIEFEYSTEYFKAKGNDKFNSKDYNSAITFYTKAIETEDGKNNPFLLGNRSLAYFNLRKFNEAFQDAKKSVEIDPVFIKGYLRLSSSLLELKRYDEAAQACCHGLLIEPENQIFKDLFNKILTQKTSEMKQNSEYLKSHPLPTFITKEDQIKQASQVNNSNQNSNDSTSTTTTTTTTTSGGKKKKKKNKNKSQNDNSNNNNIQTPTTTTTTTRTTSNNNNNNNNNNNISNTINQNLKTNLNSIIPIYAWNLVKVDSKSIGRSFFSGVAIDNNDIFYWGGENNLNGSVGTHKISDPQLRTPIFFNTKFSSFYFPSIEIGNSKSGHSMHSIGNIVYIVGGISTSNEKYHTKQNTEGSTVLCLDTSTVKFTSIKDRGTVPQHLYQSCSAAIGVTIYMFGGRKTQNSYITSNDLYRFDSTTHEWSLLPCKGSKEGVIPPNRCMAGMESLEGRYLILFGGQSTKLSFNNDLWVYDLELNEWSQVNTTLAVTQDDSSTPQPSTCHGLQKIVSESTGVTYLVNCGGLTNGSNIISDIWALDTSVFKWIRIPVQTPSALPKIVNHTTVIQNGSLYVYGGNSIVEEDDGFSHGIKTLFYPLSHDIYSFPIGRVINSLPVDPKAISPSDGSIRFAWACHHCKRYTTRKCRLCLEVSFCSEECEKQGMESHREHCSGYRQDEQTKKISALEGTIENLVSEQKRNEENLHHLLDLIENLNNKGDKSDKELVTDKKKIEELMESKIILENILKDNDEYLQNKENTHNNQLKEIKNKKKRELEQRNLEIQMLEQKRKQLELEKEEHIRTSQIELEKLKDELKKARDNQQNLMTQLQSEKLKLEQEKDRRVCPICMDRTRDHTISCMHIFCKPCLDQLLVKKCPLCNHGFKSKPRKIYLDV
eukprot:gene3209-4020_t